MVERHEYDIDDDAECDGELGEGVEDDEGEEFADPDPEPTTVPNAADVDALDDLLCNDILALRALVLVVVQVGREGGGLAHGAIRDGVDDVVEHKDVLWLRVAVDDENRARLSEMAENDDCNE